MTLTITQESYDEAVRQNMSDFDLTEEEAITETIAQFTLQGADLSEVATTAPGGPRRSSATASSPAMQQAVTVLNCFAEKTAEPDQIAAQMEIVRRECEKGIQYQILAGNLNTYKTMMDILRKYQKDPETVRNCFRTLIVLMTKQPDLLDDVGVAAMIAHLKNQKDQEITGLVLEWVKECCVMHERNRQNIFDAGILDYLKPMLEEASSNVLRQVLMVLRALVLDDDVRVDYGRAHEHARVIASDTLCAIMALLEKNKSDNLFVMDLLLTLSSLLVRTEFCKKVEDAGGLPLLKFSMEKFPNNEKIIRYAFKVIKALSGNDDCKAHIIRDGFAPLIVRSLNTHGKNCNAAIYGLACVAAVTLRSPENSKAFFDAGAPEVIVNLMNMHRNNENLQKHASWAIRNMVSRSRNQTGKFLSLGVEALLKENLKKFPKCEYDTKAALRDLGSDVQLKEEWTGKGGKLTTQAKTAQSKTTQPKK